MKFAFIKYSKIYYIFSGILIIASLLALFVYGIKFGIEFTGGSIIEVSFEKNPPANEQISKALSDLNLGEVIIQPTGRTGVILRLKEIDEATHQKIVLKLNELSKMEEKRFDLIGPSIGDELKKKTNTAVVLTLLAITLYIAFAFRGISKPVSSWKYGIASLIALIHDIIIPLGVFAILGKIYNIEITVPIVAALLTILGFSVHDTIVIFDRIRENILRRGGYSFEETVDWSLNQTFGRSISTVLTVLFVLLAIFFFGGETLKYFALALIIGITSGAYSSIFIASPILVTWHKHDHKNKK
ncbi:MAG: protein translocase subunit SecF [Candidatus Nealsonbacteria bacterium]|nr:protein translocase subunit SecF [Candidatus Nealsonbacteria bacterium]